MTVELKQGIDDPKLILCRRESWFERQSGSKWELSAKYLLIYPSDVSAEQVEEYKKAVQL